MQEALAKVKMLEEQLKRQSASPAPDNSVALPVAHEPAPVSAPSFQPAAVPPPSMQQSIVAPVVQSGECLVSYHTVASI